MIGVRAWSILVIFLLPVLAAGCLGGDASLDAEGLLEPHRRIKGSSGSYSGSSGCMPVAGPPRPDSCLEIDFGFKVTACDPSQVFFGTLSAITARPSVGSGPQQERPIGPGDHFVHCDHRLVWDVTARHMLPGSVLAIAVDYEGERVRDACTVTTEGSCTLEAAAHGGMTFYGPDEMIEHTADLSIRLSSSVFGQEIEGGDAAITRTFSLST